MADPKTTDPKAADPKAQEPQYPQIYANINCPPVVVTFEDTVKALGPEYRPFAISSDVLDALQKQAKEAEAKAKAEASQQQHQSQHVHS